MRTTTPSAAQSLAAYLAATFSMTMWPTLTSMFRSPTVPTALTILIFLQLSPNNSAPLPFRTLFK